MKERDYGKIIDQIASVPEFQDFLSYIVQKYNITETLPPCVAAITYAFLKHNGYFIPFREVTTHFNAGTTESLLFYRRLLYTYPHAIYGHDFRVHSIVTDEIENVLAISLQSKHKKFKGSTYFYNKCLEHYKKNWGHYDSDPVTIACHVIYYTGRSCGNYISESFFLRTFNLDRDEFRRLTKKMNRVRKGEVVPTSQGLEPSG